MALLRISLIAFITIITVMLSWHSSASDIKAVNLQTQSLLSGLNHWNGKQLKNMLTQRIYDNQSLINVIQDNQNHLVNTELDQDYNQFLSSLLEDQKTLIEVTDYLATIDTEKRLHLDIYLTRKPALNAKIQRILSHSLHTQSSRNVVNQVLYFTLMEKHASR